MPRAGLLPGVMPITFSACLACLAIAASADEFQPEADDSWWTRQRKTAAINAALDLGIVAYGFANWDYGTQSPHAQSEGWFGSGTRYGGADKLGHASTAYGVTSGMFHIYESWGYSRERAADYGALSALAMTTVMELGDGISATYGFSYEDQLMNTAGAALGWLRQRYPRLRELVDYRIEYLPSAALRNGDTKDITTDYSGMRYALVGKAGGIPAIRNRWLRCLELHVGYYTRGYLKEDEAYFDERTRNAYVAIGLDLSEVLGLFTDHPARTFFEYYQTPYAYLPYGLGPDGEGEFDY